MIITTMSFKVIETGGKQYKVSSGQKIKIEKIKGEFKEGDKIVFDKVLLAEDDKGVKIGAPYLVGEKLEGLILKIAKAKKIRVVKYKAKSRYHKVRGHRQPFFEIQIS